MCTTVPLTVPVLDYFSRDRHYVDVRDVAELHARALEKEEAGGQRFLVAAGTCARCAYQIRENRLVRGWNSTNLYAS